MPRYIDADKLIAHLKDEMKWCHLPFGCRSGGKGIAYGTILGLKSAISFAETLATADVARKIFEEIERLLSMHFCSCLPKGATEHYDYYEGDLADAIAELKKKYTEEQS